MYFLLKTKNAKRLIFSLNPLQDNDAVKKLLLKTRFLKTLKLLFITERVNSSNRSLSRNLLVQINLLLRQM